jgi:hypothetical protein
MITADAGHVYREQHAIGRLLAAAAANSQDATAMTEQETQFGPLDPDIVNESIPAFFIGRNKAGFWVAREAKGDAGGIFLFKSSAVSAPG